MNTAHARSTDPSTSHNAAASIIGALSELEALVLGELLRRGENGATTHELADALDLELVTVSPRLKPLAQKGFAIDSGLKRTGRSGRQSIVWRARRVVREMIPQVLL